jgi:predicted naringenin-chalcone synthase
MIEELENAISAHTSWLKNIKTAILVSSTMSNKNSDSNRKIKMIDKIESDHQCAFGKWIYETNESEIKNNIYYEKVVDLHAQFHQQAANILNLAFEGDKSQAKRLVTDDSDFIQCSEKLIATLEEWKSSL